ncbi:MAG: PQQ-binding-like beta-propeller repeat protein [Spirochaetales bacterium]|nr:PQQ-binding-like beta-propeller repeat protein [Spirochaetales bacterium]
MSSSQSRILISIFSIFLVIISGINPLYSLELIWDLPTGGKALGNPVVSEAGVIYTLSEDRHLYAISPEGHFLWKHYLYNLPEGFLTQGYDGSVYVPLFNRELASINPSGREIWRFRTEGRILFGPSVSSLGFIYLADDAQNLYCLDNRGTLRWRVVLSSPVSAPITEVPGWGILVSQNGGRISALDLRGKVLWHFLAAGNTEPPVTDGEYFYTCTDAGTLVCIDVDGGRVWSRNLNVDRVWDLIYRDSSLFFLAEQSDVSDRLFRYSRHDDKLEFIELESKDGYLADSKEYLIIISPDGMIEQITSELVYIRSLDFIKSDKGILFHPNGMIVIGAKDWRLKGFGLNLSGSFEWNQRRGGPARRGSSLALNDELQGPPDPDELYLREFLNSNDENMLIYVLNEIETGFKEGTYSGCETYILEILERLAGEGVLNPQYEEFAVTNDFPRVRMKAARLLGEYGTLQSQELLLAVFKYEWETAAEAAQMKALGGIGSDLRGKITRSLFEKMPKGGNFNERQVYAISALECLKQLVVYMGDIPDPSALEMIMTIYRGNYGRQARESALGFIGN